MITQAIILAGGRGAHLGVLTRDRSKALLPVLGKPIVARVIERLHAAGIRRFVVALGETEGQVAAYLHNARPPDVEITFSLQPAASAGLAGAIAGAARFLRPEDPFVLIGADVITPPDFLPQLLKRFAAAEQDMVLSIGQRAFAQPGSFFPVEIHGDTITTITGLGAGQPISDFGAFLACACRPTVLPYLTGQNGGHLYQDSDWPRVLQVMIDQKLRMGYALADSYFRLVTPADLVAINSYLLQEQHDAHILTELPTSVTVVPPVRVDPQVSVGQGATIGPNVYLERGCTVGQDAVVRDAVVLSAATVFAREKVESRIVSRYASVR